jgi:hypothetical protein
MSLFLAQGLYACECPRVYVNLSKQTTKYVLHVGKVVRNCFYNKISMYNLSCLVCFKYFLIVGICCISYGGFQTKVYKFVAETVLARL